MVHNGLLLLCFISFSICFFPDTHKNFNEFSFFNRGKAALQHRSMAKFWKDVLGDAKYPKPFSASNDLLIRWLGSIHGLGDQIRAMDSYMLDMHPLRYPTVDSVDVVPSFHNAHLPLLGTSKSTICGFHTKIWLVCKIHSFHGIWLYYVSLFQ